MNSLICQYRYILVYRDELGILMMIGRLKTNNEYIGTKLANYLTNIYEFETTIITNMKKDEVF